MSRPRVICSVHLCKNNVSGHACGLEYNEMGLLGNCTDMAFAKANEKKFLKMKMILTRPALTRILYRASDHSVRKVPE